MTPAFKATMGLMAIVLGAVILVTLIVLGAELLQAYPQYSWIVYVLPLLPGAFAIWWAMYSHFKNYTDD